MKYEMSTKKEKYIALLIVVGTIILYIFSGRGDYGKQISIINRNRPGDGAKNYLLEASVDGVLINDINLALSERRLSKDECERLSEKFEEELKRTILNDNISYQEINTDLTFMESIDDYPFEIAFETDQKDKLDNTGKILCAESFTANIKIDYAYDSFRKSICIEAIVKPGNIVKARIYKNKIMELLTKENSFEEHIELPKEIDGMKVVFSYPEKKRDRVILFVGFIASALVLISGRIDAKKEKDKRRMLIMKEYPVVLQKISLYLASGMTVRNVWTLISEEGVKKYGGKHPLYAEMEITANEIQSGVSEGMAYKRFGERTGVNELIRFTALLSQNIKRGSSKLGQLLYEESAQSFVVRKQRAISEGEKAGTKLLIPMMLLLVDVLVIILFPAFWSI